MRRTLLALPMLAAVLAGAAPASATTSSTIGWQPAPSKPWTVAAGVRCDFPVHGEPVVDEVVERVLESNPDGTPKTVAYKGDLVVRLTNTETGVGYDVDAGGSAIIEYRADGSQSWYVVGPVLVGFSENGGTLARGLYALDGAYTLDIGATGYKTLTMLHGTADPLCDRLG